MSSTRVLARNAGFSVAGQLLPMAAALVAIPVLIRYLGVQRFGVLTLVWAAIGYFSLFDLGLGRALTQSVASRLRENVGTSELAIIAWTSLAVMFVLGVLGGCAIELLAPVIVTRVLKIPPAMEAETLTTFTFLALSLPLVVATAGLRGLLEAHQDFAAATALRIPLAVFTFVAPVPVAAFISPTLVPVMVVLLIGRAITCVGHLVLCMRRYSYLRGRPAIDLRVIVPLIRYGGWMTASNLVSPAMVYLDRFFIGAALTLTAVAQYVTPYELITKFLILPGALIAVIFPAFASMYISNPERTAVLFERSLRLLILISFPLLLVVVLFARDGLSVWVGAGFAIASAPVLQWLAVGVFANSVAQVPFAALQGVGRPDLTAKLHLVELPLYVIALSSFAGQYGVVGVAIAWTLRCTVDLAAMLILSRRVVIGVAERMDGALVFGCGALAALVAGCFVNGGIGKILFLVAALGTFAAIGWLRMMQPDEREFLRQWSRA